MIAIDLDGTLLTTRGEVTPRTKLALRRALDGGWTICFATGRNFTESRRVMESAGHLAPSVFVGGAMVINPVTSTTMHRTLMDGELARDLCSFFESRGQAALALQDRGTAGFDYLISRDVPPAEATRQWLAHTLATVQWAGDLATHAHEHTLRVGVVASREKALQLHRDLRAHFGPRTTSHCIIVPAYDCMVIEAFDPAVNKWSGILRVAGHYGIEPQQIVAVGDDVNDVPMVRNAALGVAMGNAHPELQAVAAQVIGGNNEDGLAIFLEELVESGVAESAETK